jgi:hypothetical protein
MTELKDDIIPPEFIGRRGSLHLVPGEVFATTTDRASITLGEMVGILLVPALAVLLAYAVAGLMAGA